ncbi:MAG: tetratricopeptide repeat protein [Gammaproteobacteria bacterium]
MYNVKGDPENAAKENRIAGEIYERLAGQDPDNVQWQKGLAMSHVVTGNALMENDAARGISEFRSALALYERLVAKDPTNAELQNWVAVCHVGIATGLVAQKQWPEALTESRAALAVAEPMGAQDPKDIMMVQQTIAGAHVLIGGILKKQGDHVQATKEQMVGLELHRRLAEQDPSNAMFQFQVASSGNLLAAILLAQKKYDEALQAFAGARDVLEPLVARSPEYQSTLVDTYNGSTWPFLMTRRPYEAIAAASKAIELDATKSSTKMNLAHGYLLANQFEKAKAIYLENKDVKRPDGRGFVEVVLKDFKDLREAGVMHPDMKRIERLLSGEASGKTRK